MPAGSFCRPRLTSTQRTARGQRLCSWQQPQGMQLCVRCCVMQGPTQASSTAKPSQRQTMPTAIKRCWPCSMITETVSEAPAFCLGGHRAATNNTAMETAPKRALKRQDRHVGPWTRPCEQIRVERRVGQRGRGGTHSLAALDWEHRTAANAAVRLAFHCTTGCSFVCEQTQGLCASPCGR